DGPTSATNSFWPTANEMSLQAMRPCALNSLLSRSTERKSAIQPPWSVLLANLCCSQVCAFPVCKARIGPWRKRQNGEAKRHPAKLKWRKRVGVEPTKDRLTASPGFEVRTPHRGRFPSVVARRGIVRSAAEQAQALVVDAAQIAAP